MNCTSQNLYVQPPTRTSHDDKSNLIPRGRSRGPIIDLGPISSLDRSSSPQGHSHSRNLNISEESGEPPRPPPPRQGFYSFTIHLIKYYVGNLI